MALTPRSRNSDSVHSRLDWTKPLSTKAHAADAEVAQLIFVSEVDDVGEVTHTGLPQLVFDIEGVLKCRALTGAGAVPDADNQALSLTCFQFGGDTFERLRSLNGVAGSAHRVGVTVRTKSWGGSEIQLRASRVDEVVVADAVGLAAVCVVGVGEINRRRTVFAVSLGTDRGGESLVEHNALTSVDGTQGNQHLGGIHSSDADPDVRRDPVPLCGRRNDDDLMLTAEPAA